MLALICGSGDLPRAIAEVCDPAPLVCALDGFAPAGLDADRTFRLETFGSLLAWLTERGVTQVCLCGHIRRPKVDLAAVDAATQPLLQDLAAALSQGDDGALRVVLALFEAAGFSILAAHEAAPALLPPAGVLSDRALPDGLADQIPLAAAAIADLGAADAGQACVVRGGAVIAREDAAGTDAMLGRIAQPGGGAADPLSWAWDQADAVLGSAADWLTGRPDPGAGFLFKAPKPAQDRRADLPVIGPHTVQAAAAAGLAGIVIAAGGVMVLHRARTVAAANRAGLFLWVYPGRGG